MAPAALEESEAVAQGVPDAPLWRWLGTDPVSPDWLAQQSGLGMPEVLQQLLDLELDGRVLAGLEYHVGGTGDLGAALRELADGDCPVCFDTSRCVLCDGNHRTVNAQEAAVV